MSDGVIWLSIVGLIVIGFFAVRYHSLHRVRTLSRRASWSDRQFLDAFGQAPNAEVALAVRAAFSRFTELAVDKLRPHDSIADTLQPVMYFDDDGSDLLEALEGELQDAGDAAAIALFPELNTDTVTRASIEEVTHFFRSRRRLFCTCGYDLRGSGERCSECGAATTV